MHLFNRNETHCKRATHCCDHCTHWQLGGYLEICWGGVHVLCGLSALQDVTAHRSEWLSRCEGETIAFVFRISLAVVKCSVCTPVDKKNNQKAVSIKAFLSLKRLSFFTRTCGWGWRQRGSKHPYRRVSISGALEAWYFVEESQLWLVKLDTGSLLYTSKCAIIRQSKPGSLNLQLRLHPGSPRSLLTSLSLPSIPAGWEKKVGHTFNRRHCLIKWKTCTVACVSQN